MVDVSDFNRVKLINYQNFTEKDCICYTKVLNAKQCHEIIVKAGSSSLHCVRDKLTIDTRTFINTSINTSDL